MIEIKTVGRRGRFVLVVLVVLVAALSLGVACAMAEFGVQQFTVSAREQNGSPDVQAGSHPFALTTSFVLNQPGGPAQGDLKSLKLELPPGFVGDPYATPRCTYQEFMKAELGEASCAPETAVGIATSYVLEAEQAEKGEASPTTDPVYNLVPPPGVAAEFGFIVAKATPVLLATSVRTGADYGLTTNVPYINQAVVVGGSKVTIWGVPASHAHDLIRGTCLRTVLASSRSLESVGMGLREHEDELEGPIGAYESETIVEPTAASEKTKGCPSLTRPLPLLTNPTSCGTPRTAALTVESWEGSKPNPRTASLPEIQGCENLGFSPRIELTSEKSAASSASGLDVDIHVPQEATENPAGNAEGDVRATTVALPAGVQVNPSSADGLQACSSTQVGFTEFKELQPSVEPGVKTPQFTPYLYNPETKAAEATLCPQASKIANVKVKTPLLEGELEGGVYLASPQNFAGPLENPFGSLIALYLVAEEPKRGVLVKLAGKVSQDPATGQLTTTFQQTPELPFSDLHLEFYGGERAPLATPAHCGSYQTEASFTSWNSTLPLNTGWSFPISSGVGGGACASSPLPFAPSLAAGTSNINAGAFGPLTTSVGREDGQQSLRNISLTYPQGVSAILAGVPLCAEAQANAGTCEASSQIGEATASAGFGNDPYTVTGGEVYLTAGYGGAPFGVSIVVPAKAGPFVLEEGRPVVVRAKLEINPLTAAVTVTTTGEIPHILDGIPLQIRRVNATINRAGFALNPTNCDPMSVSGGIEGGEGTSVPVSTPFQLANCANLKFQPKIAISTAGHSSKKFGASLKFKLSYPKGALGTQAWFDEAKFGIPKQLPSELKTIQQACTAVTFEQNRAACPKHSIIGQAVVHTPVLPEPLTGPVYFVSFGNAKFPDVVMVLSGYGVKVELRGETLIKNGVTSATFRNTPDVPFESLEVNLPSGEYSEFGTNLGLGKYDFCGHELTVPTSFKAQNGLEIREQTPVAITGCPKAHKKAKKAYKKARGKRK
jgi:hypothetical protein